VVKSIIKGLLGLLAIRLIDPIEVYFDGPTNTFYPIVSKSGCSSIKVRLIRIYKPDFESRFPEIHRIDPSPITEGNLMRLSFSCFPAFRNFAQGKKMVLVIREPYERFFSCYIDVNKGKNTMYQYPSGLNTIVKVEPNMELPTFLKFVSRTPDYLSDRHFRSQSYFLKGGVENLCQSVKILDLGSYLAEIRGDSVAPKLNVNSERMNEYQLSLLKGSDRFKNRYRADIELYRRL